MFSQSVLARRIGHTNWSDVLARQASGAPVTCSNRCLNALFLLRTAGSQQTYSMTSVKLEALFLASGHDV